MIRGCQESAAEELSVEISPGFTQWLTEQNVSLAFSTYRLGKLIIAGAEISGKLKFSAAQFDRVSGITFDGQNIFVATFDQLWKLVDTADRGEFATNPDRRYVAKFGHFTGDLGIRDVAISGHGNPVFVSSRFNCVAATSDSHHFKPLWKPRFINRIVGEDRCHLNGVAFVEGKQRFVTACSQTNYFNGWRNCRRNGGVVIDTEQNEVVVHSLSMPHSPRWYRQKLWLLNSGYGSFGYIDERTHSFEHVAFCPGFARGLAFTGDYAIIGLSQSRHDLSFEGLPLQHRIGDANAIARRGLMIVDLRSGEVMEWLWAHDQIEEIFEVMVLPGCGGASITGLSKCSGAASITFEPLQ